MIDVFDAIGFVGAALVLIGYLQVSRGVWKARSYAFQLFNALGALILILYALHIDAYPNVLLNSVWLVVGLVALAKLRRA